jgi:oligopeptide transport system substrate-binding protein
VTSKDVIYSWNRAAAMQGPYATNLSAIAGYEHVANNQVEGAALEALLEKMDVSVTLTGVTAPDDYTVVVRLNSAAGWFESAIAQPSVASSIVDEKVVRDDFANWWTRPDTLVGTGAFKMVAHAINQSMDFVVAPGWWGTPKPTLTAVHVEVLGTGSSALARYEGGTYDIFGYGAYMPAASDIVRIQQNLAEKGQLVLEVKNKTYFVSFNMVADARRPAGGPFTLDQGKVAHDLRLAFNLAIDRNELAKELCAGVACIAATGGVIPKGLQGYLGDGADDLAAFDPSRARSLLQSADPTGARTNRLVYTYDGENPFNDPTAKILQRMWKDNLGVSVDLRIVPRSTFITQRLRGEYVLARDGWTADYDHPQDWFDNLWGSGAGCPDVSCSSGYVTRAYDQLLGKADGEPMSSALADYKALSKLLIDDVGYLPLYYTVGAFLIKPYVLGAGSNNLFDYYWDQIELLAH